MTGGWPRPLGPTAYHGLVGEIMRAIEPHTEADPVGLLLQTHTMVGSAIGRAAHFQAEADTHYLNLFTCLVGRTSKGRKGVSQAHSRRLLGAVDPDWAANHVSSGLSSGEGLIWAVRDPIERLHPIKNGKHVLGSESVLEDPGISDKRLLVVETELASTLRVLTREGNTLSATVRQAWDGQDLRTLTKNSPAKATQPHISIIGHITSDEVLRYLDATECANGFGNRFLWVCVQRSKLLPDGGGAVYLDPFVERLRRAIDHAKECGELRRDSAAGDLWRQIYGKLSAGRPGMLGAMTARAEAQVMRLACLYAIEDMSSVVGLPHLQAALEVWRFCFDSAAYVFGDSLGDPMADEILRALRTAGSEGLSRSEILRDVFARNRAASQVSRALAVLAEAHLVRRAIDAETGGRAAERWFATEVDDINDSDDTNDPSDDEGNDGGEQ
jgi:hypothetical protein